MKCEINQIFYPVRVKLQVNPRIRVNSGNNALPVRSIFDSAQSPWRCDLTVA